MKIIYIKVHEIHLYNFRYERLMSRYLRTREAEERGNTAAAGGEEGGAAAAGGEEGGAAAEQEQQNPPLPSPSLLHPEYMPRYVQK